MRATSGRSGLAIFLVLVIQSALSFIRIWLFGEITTRMLKALREDAFASMITQPMAFFDTRRVGDLGSRIAADIEAIRDTFTVVLAELIRQSIIIGGGLLALMTFSWKLTLLMLGTLPVAMLAAMGFGRFIRKLSKKTQDAVAGSNTIVSETLTGIVSVKAFAREAYEVARYRDRVEEVRGIALRTALWRGAFASFIIVMIFGAITIVLFQGASMLKNGELNSEQFFSFLLMTGLVAGSIGGIANIFGDLQRGFGAIEEVMDLITREREPVVLDDRPLSRPAASKACRSPLSRWASTTPTAPMCGSSTALTSTPRRRNRRPGRRVRCRKVHPRQPHHRLPRPDRRPVAHRWPSPSATTASPTSAVAWPSCPRRSSSSEAPSRRTSATAGPTPPKGRSDKPQKTPSPCPSSRGSRKASTPSSENAGCNSPAANASALPSPGPSCATRNCSCSTKPPAPSMPPARRPFRMPSNA